MPQIGRCASELEWLRSDKEPVFQLFASTLKEGEWVIRATSGGSDLEEYFDNFRQS